MDFSEPITGYGDGGIQEFYSLSVVHLVISLIKWTLKPMFIYINFSDIQQT